MPTRPQQRRPPSGAELECRLSGRQQQRGVTDALPGEPGTISRSSSNRFPLISEAKTANPATLSPGRAMLPARPAATGFVSENLLRTRRPSERARTLRELVVGAADAGVSAQVQR